MSKNKIALVANGLIENEREIASLIKLYSRIVAVDGGLNHCFKMGIDPDAYVGDLDSTKQTLLEKHPQIEITLLPREKDRTDLEVALQREVREDVFITVFAATGLRIDHTLANILLLARYPGKVWIETESEYLFAIPGKVTLECSVGQTLSLLPLMGPAKGIQTKGLKWELDKGQIDISFFGISNICQKQKIEIEVESGYLLCTILKEESRKHPLHTTF